MNVASEWFSRSMSLLRKSPPAAEEGADTVRPLAQRLKATLRRGAEANPPHVLRKLLEDLRAAADEVRELRRELVELAGAIASRTTSAAVEKGGAAP